MTPPFVAHTAYGRPILTHWLGSREDVARWIEDHGPTFPGWFVKRGNRTVARDQNEEPASARVQRRAAA